MASVDIVGFERLLMILTIQKVNKPQIVTQDNMTSATGTASYFHILMIRKVYI